MNILLMGYAKSARQKKVLYWYMAGTVPVF